MALGELQPDAVSNPSDIRPLQPTRMLGFRQGEDVEFGIVQW